MYVVYDTYPTDFEGNKVNNYQFSFTTAAGTVTTGPTVTSVTPTNGATGVGPYTTVSLTFSEPLNPATITSSNFALFNGASNLGASVGHSADDRTVTLSYGNMPGNSLITVVATNGATDEFGNALTPFTSSFTTATDPDEYSSRRIISQRPGNGATGVPANTTIYLVSNKTMNFASVQSSVFVSQNGTLVPGTISLNPAATSILFTPSAPFSAGAVVQINVTSNATDTFGNALTAYSGSFTVLPNQTTVAPTIAGLSPVNGAQNQPLNVVVDVQFTKPIMASSVTTANIFLKENDATVVPATVSLLFPNVVRITPNSPFVAASNYYRLNIAANGIQDTNGNFAAAQANDYFYTSTTSVSNTSTLTVTALAPTNGATNIGDNAQIQVSFSEPVDQLTVNGTTVSVTGASSTVMPSTIAFDSTGQIVTITPLTPLPDNATMTIAISGVTDSSGNAITPADDDLYNRTGQ